MASTYGEDRKIACPVCGMRYDAYRIGSSFAALRREIIAIDVDARTGKKKYGRRNGVLGLAHQRKWMAWTNHVEECERGLARAESFGGGERFVVEANASREAYDASELEILRARRRVASLKHAKKKREERCRAND